MNRLLVICVALTVCATYLSGVAGITCYRKIANEDPVQEVYSALAGVLLVRHTELAVCDYITRVLYQVRKVQVQSTTIERTLVHDHYCPSHTLNREIYVLVRLVCICCIFIARQHTDARY